MMPMSDKILLFAVQAGLGILSLSMVLALYRVIRGPRHADRIIALDLISVMVVALAALYTVYSGHKAYLDVAIAYALVAFLGTVAFARYLQRSCTNRIESQSSIRKGEKS